MRFLKKSLLLALFFFSSMVLASDAKFSVEQIKREEYISFLVKLGFIQNPSALNTASTAHLEKLLAFVLTPWKTLEKKLPSEKELETLGLSAEEFKKIKYPEKEGKVFHIRTPEGWVLSIMDANESEESEPIQIKSFMGQILVISKGPFAFAFNGEFQDVLKAGSKWTAGNHSVHPQIKGYTSLCIGSQALERKIYNGLTEDEFFFGFLLKKYQLISDDLKGEALKAYLKENNINVHTLFEGKKTFSFESAMASVQNKSGEALVLLHQGKRCETGCSHLKVALPEPTNIEKIGANSAFIYSLDYDFKEKI